MARDYSKKRKRLHKRLQRRKKARQILHKIGTVFCIILGFAVAISLGVLAARAFGIQVVMDDSMSPTYEEEETVRINRLAYLIADPDRMDVVVLDLGTTDSVYYVRRVVGLPGETVQIIDGVIYIDGEALEYEYNAELIEDAGIFEEAVTLDDDEFFVLGDNYNACEDSRSSAIGAVEKSQIAGKAGF